MALKQQQKNQVDENLKALDYLEGTGLLNSMKKHLAKERFLFISSGGTGHKLMKVLKENLERHVEDGDIRDRVKFLVIDTDHGELERLRREKGKGIFEAHELLKLPFQEARRTIAPGTMTPQAEAWVHPELYSVTGGEGSSAEFAGMGAGAYRQVGRVHLAQRTALDMLRDYVVEKIHSLTSNQNNLDPINVFFFCGISGGTGSGTIIDLAFLTRYFIREFNGNVYARTRFRAYLMLPSACGFETDKGKKTRGNRNAYAAMKEIDYFMNLSVRQEHFQEDYDGERVDIKENIFDFCTLVEGVGGPGIIFDDQNKVAMQVTSDSIINMITDAGLKDSAGGTQFLVDSFLCNRDVTSDIIRSNSHREWPRNAHYVYNVIGYSECVVPIDLMVAYVSMKVFDQVWQLFSKGGEVTEDKVDDFLSNCGLQASVLRKNDSFTTLKQTIEIEVMREFERFGPYYVTNLLAESIKRIQGESGMYRSEALKKSVAPLIPGKAKWEQTVRRYDRVVEDILQPWNQQIYDVYTYVIDVFKDILEKNAGILTETERYSAVFGNSYCWSPIDLTKGNKACQSVREYLDSLISQKEAEDKAKKFVRKLLEKREEWTELSVGKRTGKFNAAGEVRDFMETEIHSVVDATLEEFLVKLYSGMPDAMVTTLDGEGREMAHPAVMDAANEIVERLENQAAALVQSRYLNRCYKYLYITIPSGCKWLKKAVEEKCMEQVEVYESSAQDRIVFYRLYSGIAAYMLTWVSQAEKDYESDVNYPGLHISQSKTGRDWTRFPNLYVESLWSKEERGDRKREAAISREVRNDMDKAAGLDMIEKEEYGPYTALLPLKGKNTEDLKNALQLPQDMCLFKEIWRELKEAGLVESIEIKYTGMITSTIENPKPADFDWQIAGQAVRMNVPLMDRLHEGVRIAEEIKDWIDVHNQKAKGSMRLKERMGCLIDMWMLNYLIYDELRGKWFVELPQQDQMELTRLDGRLKIECKEYYCAEAFFALSDEIYGECTEAVEAWRDQGQDQELMEQRKRRNQWKEAFLSIRTLKRRTDQISYPMASVDFEDEAGEEADRIRKFYDRLIREL